MSKAKLESLKAHKTAGESRTRAASIKRMLQEAEDKKNQPKIDEAYEKSRTSLKKGGSVSSASKRADGIAQHGKTRA